MQRKIVSFVSLLITALLTGCASNETSLANLPSPATILSEEINTLFSLEDGLYFAKEDDFNEEGWKNILSFKIENSKLMDISFNAVNESAASTKKELFLAGISPSNSENNEEIDSWYEQIQLLESYFLYHQIADYNAILAHTHTDELLSNLTLDIEPLIYLIEKALSEGPIELGPYIDGYYYAEQEDSDNGFKYFIRLFVQNGYIIAVHWNGLHEDGISLMTDLNSEVNWSEQATRLKKFLIEIQDPMLMTFNEENKTDDVFGVSIEVNDFIELVVESLANGPIIINEN